MTNQTLIYILEYPISNWVNDELDEIKQNVPTLKYTTVGQFYKNHPDSRYFHPKNIHYLWTFTQIFFNPFRYLQILRSYRKEVGLRIVIQTIAIAAVLKQHKDFTIHCHFASSSTTTALILHHLYGYPFSFTAHAWDIYFSTVNKTLLQKKLTSAYYIRTISEYNKTHLTRIVPESQSKIHVIHCGINLENFPTTYRKPNSQTFTILSASNFVEKKGYIPFIESFKDIDISEISFQWKIAGNGPLKESLISLVQKSGLEPYIGLVPSIPHEELLDFFNTGNVFFLPCIISSNGDRDGIPVTLMEAMASGIITISTSVSGIPELIEHQKNGFLLVDNTIGELIKTINYLKQLSEKEIKDIQNNARSTIENNFDIKNIVKSHMKYL